MLEAAAPLDCTTELASSDASPAVAADAAPVDPPPSIEPPAPADEPPETPSSDTFASTLVSVEALSPVAVATASARALPIAPSSPRLAWALAAEPALALTLPANPSENDDGLLTSSEVATLRLNADWVILSACNTAAGDKPDSEALSGLARAFFYAGAKTLLVSHWPVRSAAAVRLTTDTIQMLERDRSLSPAEALRRAMVAFLESGADGAHPANWAPFVIVGTTALRQ